MSKMFRGWPGLNALSGLLFGRPLSIRWTGSTSVSDNVFEDVHRLLEIYALVCDHEKEVGSIVKSPTGKAMHEDLMHLSESLASTSRMFSDSSRAIQRIANGGDL